MHSRTIKLNSHNKVAAFAVENNCTVQESQAALDKVQEWIEGNLDRIVDEEEERRKMAGKMNFINNRIGANILHTGNGDLAEVLSDMADVLSYLMKRLK